MNWVARYSDFISETDSYKAQSRLEALESAIFFTVAGVKRPL